MAVSLASTGTVTHGTGTAPTVVNTGSSGQYAVYVLAGAGFNAPTAPTGWTQVASARSDTSLSLGVRLNVYGRLLDGTANDTPNMPTLSGSNDWQTVMFAFSGVDTTTPIDITAGTPATSGATAGTAPSQGAVTTATDHALAIYVVCDNPANVAGQTESAHPTSFGNILDNAGTNRIHIAVDTLDQTSAGSTGTVSSTLTKSARWVTTLFALRAGGSSQAGAASTIATAAPTGNFYNIPTAAVSTVVVASYAGGLMSMPVGAVVAVATASYVGQLVGVPGAPPAGLNVDAPTGAFYVIPTAATTTVVVAPLTGSFYAVPAAPVATIALAAPLGGFFDIATAATATVAVVAPVGGLVFMPAGPLVTVTVLASAGGLASMPSATPADIEIAALAGTVGGSFTGLGGPAPGGFGAFGNDTFGAGPWGVGGSEGAQYVPTYRYLYANLLTGEILGELPFETCSYVDTLNSPGSIKGTLPLNVDIPNLADDLGEGRTAVYVERDGVIMAGGIVWGLAIDVKANGLDVLCEGPWSYFNLRTLRADLSFDTLDQSAIAKALIDWAQTQPGGSIRVDTSSMAATGTLVSRDYVATDRKKVGALLSELAAVDGGFDLRFQYDWIGGQVVCRALVTFPNTGRLLDLTFAVGGNVEALTLTGDGKSLANLVDEVGQADVDGNAPVVTVATGGAPLSAYPLLDDVETQSSVSDEAVLTTYAKRRLARGRAPIRIPSLQVAPTGATGLGTYSVGDIVTVEGSFGFLVVDGTYRITQRAVDVGRSGAEVVKLAVAPSGIF